MGVTGGTLGLIRPMISMGLVLSGSVNLRVFLPLGGRILAVTHFNKGGSSLGSRAQQYLGGVTSV